MTDTDQVAAIRELVAKHKAKAMEKAEDSITKPVAELKVSIEELANTMNQLSRNVLVTSPHPEQELPSSEDKISQLQEEIAKLTKTLEMMQLKCLGLSDLWKVLSHLKLLLRSKMLRVT